jgi:hypothetical protein
MIISFAELERGWKNPQSSGTYSPVTFAEKHTPPTKEGRFDLHSRAERIQASNPGLTYAEAALQAETQSTPKALPKQGISVSYESRKLLAERADAIQQANPGKSYAECAILAERA